jgi:hypothetical protein
MRRATAVLVLAAMLAIGGPAVSGAAAHESHSRYWKVRVPPSMAVYEWHNAGDLAPVEVQRRLRFLRANGFRTVYLEVGKYLDAADASDRELLRAIRGQIRRFVATATGYGLSVQALGGGPDWFGEPRGYLGPALVNLVASYNRYVDTRERLAGVHLDLEPYTRDSWRAPASVRANVGLYLDTLAEIVGAYRAALGTRGNRNLQLGLAIPFWFDGNSEEVPDDIDFRHDDDPDPNPKPVAFHVIDLVADLPGAYLVIMAYRWFTGTSNGSIALARDEFRYAAKAGARSGLVVGQRYSPVPPDGDPEEAITTFHGLPRWRFWRAAAEIALAFRRYPQFRGLSVDDVDALIDARP